MNTKEIKEIIELMKENNIEEFQMERDGLKIVLKRSLGGVVKQVMPQDVQIVQPAEGKTAHPAKEELIKENIAQITSPMVGTFYSAPSPDSPPYVVTGTEVKENGVVCIIEAMKVMNEIKAEMHGRIKEILVKNGEAVEFGQPLFVVEKM